MNRRSGSTGHTVPPGPQPFRSLRRRRDCRLAHARGARRISASARLIWTTKRAARAKILLATARSLADAVDADYRDLIKPAVDAYLADKIDEAELKRRKAEARGTSPVPVPDHDSYDAYLKAVEKRETWQKRSLLTSCGA